MSIVGLIVNPIAGKDIRRLAAPASHTSDSAKIEIVRRAVIAAVEAGAERVLLSPDPHQLGRRALTGLNAPAEILDLPTDGSRRDTVNAAEAMWKNGAGAVVALGGDGTCRDVALGWPDAVLIAISTGTNNVYPRSVDATSAGSAAGFVASGAIDASAVARRSKRLSVAVTTDDTIVDDLALVEVALIDTAFVGSRAVLDPHSIRVVIAAIASPASTGLSSIAGRIHPVGRWEAGGVMVRLGAGGRPVRAPLSPGSFSTVYVVDVQPLADGETVSFEGPGVLALDGERDRRLGPRATAAVRVEMAGPMLIDVDATLRSAAARHLFETNPRRAVPEEHDGH